MFLSNVNNYLLDISDLCLSDIMRFLKFFSEIHCAIDYSARCIQLSSKFDLI